MAFTKSPGITVSEIDLSAVTPAIGTTEAAIAGHFRWGPVGERALITTEDELVKTFQRPNANTADDFFTAANFLAYGNQLFTTRVVNEGGSTAENARNAITNAANTQNTLVKSEDDYDDRFLTTVLGGSAAISGVGPFIGRYPGELGNSLRVSICPTATAFSNAITGNVSITSGTTALAGNGTFFTNQLRSGDILVLGPAREEIKVKTISSDTAVVLQSNYQGNTIVDGNSAHRSNATVRKWEYFRLVDSAPGTSAYVQSRGGSGDQLHVVVVDENGQWSGTANTVLEVYESVSKARDAKNPQGSSIYYPLVINESSEYVFFASHSGSLTGAGGLSTTSFGGADVANTDSLIYGRDGALPTNGDYLTGYDLFNNPEDVDISFVLGSGANQTRAIDLINNLAEQRKDCVVVLSPERTDVVNNSSFPGKEAEDVVTFRNTLPSSSFAIMDSGFKYQYDKYNDVYRYVPLNGDTAGIMARSDTQRDPWFSPAGFSRGQVKNVIKLAFNPRKADREVLYAAGVNPVVTFPGQGTVLFGDKTLLAQPSAFDRINVRRLFIVLEKTISIASRQSLFEFNDEITRSQFVNLVEPFLREVQGRRGITDFRVICDESNNTGEVIDRNEFVGDIFVKPNRSINFIQLNFVAVRTGVEFNEVIGAV
tara:strand:+ start:1719 stop:3683 length:1965 start_codon:yes stop_codon:yes gene_type:complete